MSAIPLKINETKTSKANIVDLLNHTYPTIAGVLSMDTYTYVAAANSEVPGCNTKLTITSTPESEVQGTIDKYYSRVDITQPRIELEDGQTVESYLTNVKKVVVGSDNFIITDHPTVPDVKIVSSTTTSLLYIGTLELKVFVPPVPLTLDEAITGAELNGFDWS